jgi:hypothetical protein
VLRPRDRAADPAGDRRNPDPAVPDRRMSPPPRALIPRCVVRAASAPTSGWASTALRRRSRWPQESTPTPPAKRSSRASAASPPADSPRRTSRPARDARVRPHRQRHRRQLRHRRRSDRDDVAAVVAERADALRWRTHGGPARSRRPRGSSRSAGGLPCVSATIRSRTRSSSGPAITIARSSHCASSTMHTGGRSSATSDSRLRSASPTRNRRTCHATPRHASLQVLQHCQPGLAAQHQRPARTGAHARHELVERRALGAPAQQRGPGRGHGRRLRAARRVGTRGGTRVSPGRDARMRGAALTAHQPAIQDLK